MGQRLYFYREAYSILQVRHGTLLDLDSMLQLKTIDAEHTLPLSAPAKRFRFEGYIKTLSQKIITTCRLLIAIEHALRNWPLLDFRK